MLWDFSEALIFSTHLRNINIKFHENPSSEGRVVHADGRIHMTKLVVAYRNFANILNKIRFCGHSVLQQQDIPIVTDIHASYE